MDQLLRVDTRKMRDLADFLETVPPEDFSLADWQSQTPRREISIGPIVLRTGCGFAGCAMGWAAYSGKFEGLRISRETIRYRGLSGMRAAAKFLNVTETVAEFFFDESWYGGVAEPADVATRLRRFAEKVEARVGHRSGAAWLKKVCGPDVVKTAATTGSVGIVRNGSVVAVVGPCTAGSIDLCGARTS